MREHEACSNCGVSDLADCYCPTHYIRIGFVNGRNSLVWLDNDAREQGRFAVDGGGEQCDG